MKKQKATGILFIAFPILLQIPFTLLAIRYDYPDILREPAGSIMQSFHQGGPSLIGLWYAYALSILIFAAALLRYRSLSRRKKLESSIRIVGFFSAAIQMIALLRWTFIVPLLSRLYVEAPSDSARSAIEAIFAVQHQFLGVGLGEHIGQLTLSIWTVLMVRDHAGISRGIDILGLSAALVLCLGLIEHLAEVFTFSAGIFAEGALVGFLLWSVWLILVGVGLIRGSHRDTP